MADRSRIEWTDATWNPISGCSHVSRGCDHCYAERMAARFGAKGMISAVHGKSRVPGRYAAVVDHGRWNGRTQLAAARMEDPLRWRRPRRIFVCSMGDLFHESVPDEIIAHVFAVIAAAQQHTFMILTKRPRRMREYCHYNGGLAWDYARALDASIATRWGGMPWPLPNVWLGVSVEDQAAADARVPLLLQTPAARRFVSCEPLLGAVDMRTGIYEYGMSYGMRGTSLAGIDLLIAGGESGPGARPLHPDWPRLLRDQCRSAGVPYFFKGWGAWAPTAPGPSYGPGIACVDPSGEFDEWKPGTVCYAYESEGTTMKRVGKRAAGHLLDGREWREMPR